MVILGCDIHGFLFCRSDISDEQIDSIIQAAIRTLPGMGERMVMGLFRSRKLKVQRRRVRESIRRVDSQGVMDRKARLHRRIKRRIYSVPYPHFLWHIDGNHKLIRWGLVIHSAIDGYSRACLYLSCSNNNRSETVLKQFKSAVTNFQVVPKHVRSDYGTENVQVWEAMMNSATEPSDHPIFLGSSVHNQRVERFNGEINRLIREKFATIFYGLEIKGLLDITSSLDLFALHYVFIPRVNAALALLSNCHNNHSISTESNRTPNQLLCAHGYTAPSSTPDDSIQTLLRSNRLDSDEFLTDYYLDHLSTNVSPLTEDDDEGRTVYEAVREYVHLYSENQ